MVQTAQVMSKERLDRYICEAAKAAGYEEGFGIKGCDLSLRNWWSVYTRQSTREQAENDRLADYLLSSAKLAKQRSALIPWEYVIYDAESSEDLNQPEITRLRKELVAGRHVTGVIILFQGRLSADPLHQLTFERECSYYGVQIIYGDAPGGQAPKEATGRLLKRLFLKTDDDCERF